MKYARPGDILTITGDLKTAPSAGIKHRSADVGYKFTDPSKSKKGIPRKRKTAMKKYSNYFAAAALFLLLCFSAFIISRNSETLSEYAGREPETAYQIQQNKETEETESSQSITAASSGEGFGKEAEKPQTPAADDASTDSGDDIRITATTQKAPTDQGEETTDMYQNERYPDRIIYQPDFYYEPLSEDMKQRITGLSYKDDCPIPYDDLRYVSVLYVNFKGNTSMGELICHKDIAQDLVEIFYELYQAGYQIEQIRLIDEYGADDLLSMQDNNTSCFNYRTIAGTNKISMHGQGLAIDINPFFNPYVTYKNGRQHVSPQGAESYADRSQSFAFKIDENDLCYKLFTAHGFQWGGNWNYSKDYQHFEKKPEHTQSS